MEKIVYEKPELIDFQAENRGFGADCGGGICAGTSCNPYGCDASAVCNTVGNIAKSCLSGNSTG